MIFNLERYLQPLPTETQVSYIEYSGMTFTPITRFFRAPDVLACGLCPKGQGIASYCDETQELCVCRIVAPGRVSHEDARLYRRYTPRLPRLDAAN